MKTQVSQSLSLGVPPEQKGPDRHKKKKHLDQDLEIRVENLSHLWGTQIYRNYERHLERISITDTLNEITPIVRKVYSILKHVMRYSALK